MKKDLGQTKILKLDNISAKPNISEIIKLSEIQSIYYTIENTNVASEKKYVFVTILKGRENTNKLCFSYNNLSDVLNRFKKILFFLVKNKNEIENEYLVVTGEGIFLSSEIDVSEFNPNSVII